MIRDTRNIDTYKVQGYGDEKKIAIVMTMHGIGDDIFAMPAIKAKRDEGFEITVFCKPFSRKVWQSLGCTVHPSVNENDESLVSQNNFIGYDLNEEWKVISLKESFGTIYYMNQWSVWVTKNGSVMNRNRIHLFAELIETKIMGDFSWIEFLKPQFRVSKPYIIFAPDSASKDRGLSSQRKLYKELKKKHTVVVLGQSTLYHNRKKVRLPRFGKKDFLRVNFSRFICGVQNNFLKLFSLDRKKVLCKTFDNLLAIIYNADFIVSADNGIFNIARAFGKKTVGIFGYSNKIIAEQYDEFINAPYSVVKCEADTVVRISDNMNLIIERTKQWEQHIMA